MTIVMFGGKRGGLQAKEHHPNREARGGSIMLWWCFAAGGTGALQKIDGFMKKENYVDILRQHLKTSLKLGRKWVFHMDNDPKHTSKVVAKWLWSGHHKALTSIIQKVCG
ncbi:unnamed protein product [Oncorhynchus mykiss]|uniref:Tc1-like transposase DDE domain-containing protein n=1 Tax=Oncorhynchus mykiss TaxID=8022 RepID=A0A060W2U0_ONCMY|nr:unnamed protein product [Oncorhynchus mykiss]